MKRAHAVEAQAPSEPCKPSEEAKCAFCRKTFKVRGLARHHKHCDDKPKHPLTAPQNYRFCLPNEQLFEYILSFLGNQTLTKLQGVTGDYYANCRQDLARLCCSCENDNLALIEGMCMECEAVKNPLFQEFVSANDAKDLYGIKRFTGIPRQDGRSGRLYASNNRKIFARADLEKHVLETFGSKMKWLKAVAIKDKEDRGRRKIVAKRIHAQAECDVVLRTLPKACVTYLEGESALDAAALKVQAERFLALSAALKSRGLKLRVDSNLCRRFVMDGAGKADEIVDTMEEMDFLFDLTDYTSRCKRNIGSESLSVFGISADAFGFYGSFDDDYYGGKQLSREVTKMELCIEYLQHGRGFTLPRKWEACRERYDYTESVGAMPKMFMQFIYTGSGKSPKSA